MTASTSGAQVAEERTPTPYDPATETDRRIRQHITRDPVTGKAIFVAFPYPVGAIVQNLLATNHDQAEVLRSFPELPAEALQAAERFWELHADDIRSYVE